MSEDIPEISWADFEKVLIVAGTVTRVEAFPEARKPAWKVWADFGPYGERKTSAQIKQEFGDVFHQGVLDFALLRLAGQSQEVEAIRVFQRLTSQVRLRLGQTGIEIGHCRAAALQQAGFDVNVQHIA